MKKPDAQRLWLAIRLHLVFEIIRYHERTVLILKKSKGQSSIIDKMLEKQIAEVAFSVQRIKSAPAPIDLNYLCYLIENREPYNKLIGALKANTSNGFFPELFSPIDMKRYVYDLLHSCVDFRYISDEKNCLRIESGKDNIITITKNNEIRFSDSNVANLFMVFLNKVSMQGCILDQEAFDKFDFETEIYESIYEKVI